MDDDGDRILDNLERAAVARAAQAEPPCGQVCLTPVLPLSIDATANANAGGLTKEQSDAALAENGQLEIGGQSPEIGPGEIDCGGGPDPNNPDGWIGGLVYCSRGGTGSVFGVLGPLGGGPEFPECCDPIVMASARFLAGLAGPFTLGPGATRSEPGMC